MSTAWPNNWRGYARWAALYERYRIAYGMERALRITQGLDERTNADLASWDRVSGEKAA